MSMDLCVVQGNLEDIVYLIKGTSTPQNPLEAALREVKIRTPLESRMLSVFSGYFIASEWGWNENRQRRISRSSILRQLNTQISEEAYQLRSRRGGRNDAAHVKNGDEEADSSRG